MTPVTAVVVTFNSSATIARCLASIPASVDLVVIDNHSSDDTVSVVTDLRPGAHLVRQTENLGFAGAVNAGVERAPDDTDILLVNPDAAVAPGAVSALSTFLSEHPGAGAVSARIVDPAGRTETVSAGWEPSLLRVTVDSLGAGRPARHALYDAVSGGPPVTRDWVAMTCVLVGRSAWVDVGPLDESYFLYCEDVDWCGRARARGWDIWIVPDVVAVHERSASVGSAGPWVDKHRIGSLDRYYSRTHGRISLTTFRAVRASGLALRAAAFGLRGWAQSDAEERARAVQRWRDARLALAPEGDK